MIHPRTRNPRVHPEIQLSDKPLLAQSCVGKFSTEHLYLPSMADFLWMGAGQQEHQNKDECRSDERKIRRFRYGISSQIVFDHDQPPSKGN
jgi:hypothetical protein